MTTAPFDITQAMQDSHPHFQPTLQSRNERNNMNTADYTPEELRLCADAKEAYDKGLPIEHRNAGTNGGNWYPCKDQFTLNNGWRYRPKPQPKTRPWSKPEDVPGPVCWLRYKLTPTDCSMIIGIDRDGIESLLGPSVKHDFWVDLKNQEHSTTRLPDSWQPCEVTEEQS